MILWTEIIVYKKTELELCVVRGSEFDPLYNS